MSRVLTAIQVSCLKQYMSKILKLHIDIIFFPLIKSFHNKCLFVLFIISYPVSILGVKQIRSKEERTHSPFCGPNELYHALEINTSFGILNEVFDIYDSF